MSPNAGRRMPDGSLAARRAFVVSLAIGFLVVLAGIAGCATVAPLPPGKVASVELVETPFFPQERFQCGPAAIAMVLRASGVDTEPRVLERQLFIPDRRGSLQLELVAAARRHGRVPYEISPRLAELVTFLEAGQPVLVLQNLGIRWLPRWHYAVVIGFSRADDTITLRSGTRARLVMESADFDRTWARAGRWGLLVLPPEQLPDHVDVDRYLAAVIDLERAGFPGLALTGYRSVLDHDPGHRTALFGLGSVAHRLGDLAAAERAYLELLGSEPGNPLVLNNLAEVLLARGCVAEARQAIDRALAALPPDHELRVALTDTAARTSAAGTEPASVDRSAPAACAEIEIRSP